MHYEFLSGAIKPHHVLEYGVHLDRFWRDLSLSLAVRHLSREQDNQWSYDTKLMPELEEL